jgi:hypothetical protein
LANRVTLLPIPGALPQATVTAGLRPSPKLRRDATTAPAHGVARARQAVVSRPHSHELETGPRNRSQPGGVGFGELSGPRAKSGHLRITRCARMPGCGTYPGFPCPQAITRLSFGRRPFLTVAWGNAPAMGQHRDPFGGRPFLTVAWGNAPGLECRHTVFWPKAIFTHSAHNYCRCALRRAMAGWSW